MIRNKRNYEKPYNKRKLGIRRRMKTRTIVNAPVEEIIKKLVTMGAVRRVGENKEEYKGTRLGYIVNQDHSDILRQYNRKMRGIANYYSFATNFSRLGRVFRLLAESCALTLASKYKQGTAAQTYKKLGGHLKDPGTGYKL